MTIINNAFIKLNSSSYKTVFHINFNFVLNGNCICIQLIITQILHPIFYLIGTLNWKLNAKMKIYFIIEKARARKKSINKSATNWSIHSNNSWFFSTNSFLCDFFRFVIFYLYLWVFFRAFLILNWFFQWSY